MESQNDENIQNIKFTNEQLVNQIENGIFEETGKNSKDRSYREKARKIVTRMKGNRNSNVRNLLKTGNITVNEFCKLSDKQLDDDKFFDKFCNNGENQPSTEVKKTYKPPVLKKVPQIVDINLSSSRDITEYYNSTNQNEGGDEGIETIEKINEIKNNIEEGTMKLNEVGDNNPSMATNSYREQFDQNTTPQVENEINFTKEAESKKVNPISLYPVSEQTRSVNTPKDEKVSEINPSVKQNDKLAQLKNMIGRNKQKAELNKSQLTLNESYYKEEQQSQQQNFPKTQTALSNESVLKEEKKESKTIINNDKQNEKINSNLPKESSTSHSQQVDNANYKDHSTNNQHSKEKDIDLGELNKTHANHNLTSKPYTVPTINNDVSETQSVKDESIKTTKSISLTNSQVPPNKSHQKIVYNPFENDSERELNIKSIPSNMNVNMFCGQPMDTIDKESNFGIKINSGQTSPKPEIETRSNYTYTNTRRTHGDMNSSSKDHSFVIRERMRNLSETKIALETHLELANKKCEVYEKELFSLRTTVNDLKIQLSRTNEEAFKLEISRLKQSLTAKEKENEMLSKENSNLKSQIKKYEENVENIIEENKKFRIETEKRFAQYNQEIQSIITVRNSTASNMSYKENIKEEKNEKEFINILQDNKKDNYNNSTFKSRPQSILQNNNIGNNYINADDMNEGNNYNYNINNDINAGLDYDHNNFTNGNPNIIEEVGGENYLNMNGNTYDEMKDLKEDDNLQDHQYYEISNNIGMNNNINQYESPNDYIHSNTKKANTGENDYISNSSGNINVNNLSETRGYNNNNVNNVNTSNPSHDMNQNDNKKGESGATNNIFNSKF